VLLGTAIAVDVAVGVGVRFVCLIVLGCRRFPLCSVSSEAFTELFWVVDRGRGSLLVVCSDSFGDDLAKFGWAGAFERNFDHEGLFLNGDLVMTTFPVRSVTAFFD
jgi:hypothetical protein